MKDEGTTSVAEDEKNKQMVNPPQRREERDEGGRRGKHCLIAVLLKR